MVKKIANRITNLCLIFGISGMIFLLDVFIKTSDEQSITVCDVSEIQPFNENVFFQCCDSAKVATLPQTVSCTVPVVVKADFGSASLFISAIVAKEVSKKYYGFLEIQNQNISQTPTTFIDFQNFRS